MTGERPLFPPDQLVFDETRRRWRERLEFLKAHEGLLDEYQVTFVHDWIVKVANREDMNFNQSKLLNRTYHRVEEVLG
jgi:hypothetical protein